IFPSPSFRRRLVQVRSSSASKAYAGFLFDMDGTIINSIAAAERVWGRWALRQGLDLASFLPTMHGKRGIDTIGALNLPGLDPAAEARTEEHPSEPQSTM